MLSQTLSRIGLGRQCSILPRRAVVSTPRTAFLLRLLRPSYPRPCFCLPAARRLYSPDRPSSSSPRPSPIPAKPTPKPPSRDAPDSQPRVVSLADAKGDVLHEDIYTIPNFLTLTRLIAAPVIGYLVLHDTHAWAVGLFAYAGVTDLLDGWIARRWNRKTVVGTVIDPMADKALMTILTVCLAVKGALPRTYQAPSSSLSRRLRACRSRQGGMQSVMSRPG
ncbi:Cardiolipin synthase (CMP-forming) [Purpureocillium takamizusanense]|uniref:Cardiolipin synthase (CMP-forming) n=1 Tax=Purpureocillium takamizusanense TaxID=2060973 RepID=A0A9Q8QBK6_9HYPO|nr:Cardiolipin synthase (CMP-forming) [Purpureocillium takamizusanense]UNI16257.1 Cardiolipin synthase (CMP-forming) [Purpureocillium takamizusanense]